MNHAATQVVELTPPGRAAVAVVLVSGPAAAHIVDQCFSPISGKGLRELPIGQIALGRWGGAEGEEVIACRRATDSVEVHCHGGAAAVRGMIDRLVQNGGCRVAWQDWVRATEGDPIRAAARAALADATTARTAAILLDQYHGALTMAVSAALSAAAAEDWSQAGELLDAVLAQREVGRHLTSPWRVVITGPPNVGKSSLLNALAGFQRAIVSPLPGTTRDVVTLTTAIDGWPVQMADTAGLRAPGDELEAAGVELAETAIAEADLLIAVHDATIAGRRSAASLRGNASRLNVLNKADLLSVQHREALLPTDSDAASMERAFILTSATNGEGIATLIAAIGRELAPAAPPAGAAVPFVAEQFTALEQARAAVGRCDHASAQAALQPLLAR
jgi:tRNA modification GTPase